MDPVQSLSNEPIARLGPFPMVSVSPVQSVRDAVLAMRRHRAGCVLVIENEKAIGVLTERDILRRIGASLPLNVPVSDAISRKVWSIRPDATVGDAIRAMNQHRCRRLVVLAEDGKAKGILSVKRIAHSLVEHFPSTVYNLPPAPHTVQKDREGA